MAIFLVKERPSEIAEIIKPKMKVIFPRYLRAVAYRLDYSMVVWSSWVGKLEAVTCMYLHRYQEKIPPRKTI